MLLDLGFVAVSVTHVNKNVVNNAHDMVNFF